MSVHLNYNKTEKQNFATYKWQWKCMLITKRATDRKANIGMREKEKGRDRERERERRRRDVPTMASRHAHAVPNNGKSAAHCQTGVNCQPVVPRGDRPREPQNGGRAGTPSRDSLSETEREPEIARPLWTTDIPEQSSDDIQTGMYSDPLSQTYRVQERSAIVWKRSSNEQINI